MKKPKFLDYTYFQPNNRDSLTSFDNYVNNKKKSILIAQKKNANKFSASLDANYKNSFENIEENSKFKDKYYYEDQKNSDNKSGENYKLRQSNDFNLNKKILDTQNLSFSNDKRLSSINNTNSGMTNNKTSSEGNLNNLAQTTTGITFNVGRK